MNIRPLRALRPAASVASLVAAVPYDVVDADEARRLAAGNDKSFLHVSRPEIDLPEGTDPASNEAYAQARRALDSLVAQGALVHDDVPCYYAYRQEMCGRAQTGIVALFDTKDYLAGVIKQHEKTRKDKEDDRTRHIQVLQAHTGPAFLTYRDDKAINELVFMACREKPLYDFTAPDGVRHTVWAIARENDCKADEIAELFARIPCAYIADGHHRSAAAARYAREKGFAGEARWFLAVCFPASQLKIFPYNRLVKDLNGLDKATFLGKLSKAFALDSSRSRHARMYLDGEWYDLSWDLPEGSNAVDSLDVSYLQENLLSPILGIQNPRTDKRIYFMGGIKGEQALADKVDAGEAAVAFSMCGVDISEIMAIADSGAVMPPKSTWFEPKLRSGLFIHKVE